MAQPVITQNPTNYSVSIGANVTFSVVVDPSSLPATYQWQKDSANLAEATDRLLTLTNVQPSLAGSYRVTVRNGSGSVTSEPGTLSVDNSFTKITSGPIVTEAGISVGCAWGDYNNDGWIDLFVIRGSVLEKSQNMLYQNNGDGTFTKVTTGAVATDTSNSLGATWGDYDNDGRLDLFVARAGGQTNALYRNLGDGTFTSVTSASFALRGGRTQAGVWGDFDNDGNLDLFLTGRDTSLNSLYQNSGNGTFVKVTQNVFGVLWSGNYRPGIWGDYDNDGDLDIFLISFASTSNWLFRNQGDGVFIPTNGGEAVVASSGSRGAAWADFDNDGDLDMFVANAVGRGNRLYQNNGNGTFSRLPAPTLPVSLANSAYPAWGDYDNDGFIDLFVPNGESTGDNNTLYHNNGDGTFTRVETGSLVNDAGHSVACGWADFDNNGFLDLFVGNLQGETNFLYRSNGNANHWLKFKVVGTTSNRSGIGAKVRVAANIRGAVLLQLREISAGSGHNGGELIAHFGLGDARTADAVRVEWPSGKVQELTNVAADQFMTLTEPEGNLPLAVRTHPKDTFAGIGETADLFVTATGPAPLRFQWLRDGQPLPGATNQLLTLSPVQRTAEGDYSAIVNGAGNSLTSRVAHLTIDPFTRVSGPISEIGGSRGGAWADYDKDGDQDLLVWNGGAVRKSNYLFRNDGNAGFIRITEGPVAGDTSDHHSAAWADLDNDGDLDLFSANFDDDPNDLFRNNGNGSFERAGPGTEENDFAGFGGASWADYDNDGLVDLFIANSRGRPHALYRNAGNGSLSKVTTGEIPGAGADSRGAAWSDYDQDGRMDLFVATGDGKNFLFQNQGNGAFVNESRSVVETGEAVGGVWGDYNNDGRPDLLVVSEVEANTLFRNEGNGVFSPVSVEDIATNPIGSLGAVFGDYDNDGFLDLFVAGAGRNALYRNTGDGSFTWIADTQIVTVDGLSFQASWADYDNDGFLDLFVANGGHLLDIPNALFRNNGNGNHWVKFRLTGTKSNRAAIGAKIRVQARIGGKDLPQIREITGGDGYSNTQPLEAHFGLGDADRIDTVRIEWPSGKVQELRNVAANQILTITEQDSAPQLAVTLQGGELKFSLSAEPNSSYRIEISPDLKTWSTLTTVSIPAAGSAGTFTDRLQAGQAARFYRAVRP